MPEPGWYPDPAHDSAWRWWDGTAWTQQTAAPSGAVAPASPAADVVAQETSLARWAKIALVAYAVITLLSAVLFIPLVRGLGTFLREVLANPEAYADSSAV